MPFSPASPDTTHHGLMSLLSLMMLSSISCGSLDDNSRFASNNQSTLPGPSGPKETPAKKSQTPNQSFFAPDYTLFSRLDSIPVGSVITLDDNHPVPIDLLRNTGFLQESSTSFRRESRLDQKISSLQYFDSPFLANIDCIVMLSIHRRKEEENYIFNTLKETFSSLPSDIVINILVGNDDDDYLSIQNLSANLDEDMTDRIRVHRTATRESSFLAANMPFYSRAAWNYSRAVLSYSGTKGLLVLEDDLNWSRQALNYLSKWTSTGSPDIISLYTRKNYLRPRYSAFGSLILMPSSPETPRFECSQAMFFRPDVANDLGHYLLPRLTTTSYDWNIDAFINASKTTIGYAFPSLVQHMGRKSSGLGSFHQSDCFCP